MWCAGRLLRGLVASERPAYSRLRCVVAELLSVLGSDSSVLGRTTGYYDRLKIVQADRQLFNIWKDRYTDRHPCTHASSHSTLCVD